MTKIPISVQHFNFIVRLLIPNSISLHVSTKNGQCKLSPDTLVGNKGLLWTLMVLSSIALLTSCPARRRGASMGNQLSEEFELTANSLGAHIETHGGLILRTLSYLTVNSQDGSHCELAVSFLWVCNSHCDLAVQLMLIDMVCAMA